MPNWLPPAADVQAALTHAVLPAFGAAAAVFGLLTLLKRNAEVSAAVAFLVGLAAANYFRGIVPWIPDGKRIEWVLPLTAAATLAGLLVRWKAFPAPLAVGLLAAVAFFAGGKYGQIPAWAGATVCGLLAAAFTGLSRDTARHTPWLFAAALNTSAVLAISAHSARLTDLGTIGFAAVAGIGSIALLFRQPAATPLFGAMLLLAAVSLLTFQDTYSDIPWYAFALPAAAPAVALLFPDRWPRVRFAVTLLGCGAAVGLAQYYEPLDFSQLS